MKKYDVRVCDCGRVHFIDEEKINKAIENEKEVLIVCNHCGSSFIVGADETVDDDGNTCYMMYSYSMKDKTIEDTSKIDTIVFTLGESIRMMTGGEATYHGTDFIDFETKKPESISNEEWEIKRKTVDTQRTINWIKNDDKLEQLSHYCLNIDWKGTKFEKSYHK